jgi:hypothetical protein
MIKKSARILEIPRFDGVDGFTIRHGESRQPLHFPGLGRLDLASLPAGAWPILLEAEGETTALYFQIFLSTKVLCWRAETTVAETTMPVAPPEFDRLLQEAIDLLGPDPTCDWFRQTRKAQRDDGKTLAGFVPQHLFSSLEKIILFACHNATGLEQMAGRITAALYHVVQKLGCDPAIVAKLITPDSGLDSTNAPVLSFAADHVHQIRLLLGAWASLTKDLLLTFNGGQRENLAPPVIESLAPFAKINTIKITFAEDAAKRAQLRVQVDPAMIRAALRGERHAYGRTFESLQHLSRALNRMNHEFRDGRQLVFSFGDKSVDPGLRFDRDCGSEEPLIPDLDLLTEIAKWEEAGRSLAIYQGPPFLEREKKLFWRGSTTGSLIRSLEEFRDNHRVQACLHTIRELPEHADCKIARIVQTAEEIQQDAKRFLSENKILSRIIDPRDFAQYQMFLDLPGNASAWGSSLRYLQGMLVFRVAHPHELLYYESLQPWEHFIPVAADLSDLKSGVEWALLHQHEAAQIASNGRACILEFLTNGDAILQNVLRDNLEKARPGE